MTSPTFIYRDGKIYDPSDKRQIGVVRPNGEETLFPYILDQAATPRILPSSGTSNATGQITHTTALPYQPSGVVWTYLPAGVVTAGSAGTGAGLYPVIYSSTTVCQIQGTGIVTANGAYTQTTASDITLAAVVVPGGAMGANGSLRVAEYLAVAGTAGNKICNVVFGGSTVIGQTITTGPGATAYCATVNRGSQAINVSRNLGTTTATGVNNRSTIDTSINQNLTFTGQLAVATDFIILEGYTVEVLPN